MIVLLPTTPPTGKAVSRIHFGRLFEKQTGKMIWIFNMLSKPVSIYHPVNWQIEEGLIFPVTAFSHIQIKVWKQHRRPVLHLSCSKKISLYFSFIKILLTSNCPCRRGWRKFGVSKKQNPKKLDFMQKGKNVLLEVKTICFKGLINHNGLQFDWRTLVSLVKFEIIATTRKSILKFAEFRICLRGKNIYLAEDMEF